MRSEQAENLSLHVERTDRAAIVHIRGSAGMNEAESLRETLEQVAGWKPEVIVLDLRQMDFICSTGLSAVLDGHLRCRHHHGRILLVNPQPAVRQLLETTRLTKLFPICASVEEAVKA